MKNQIQSATGGMSNCALSRKRKWQAFLVNFSIALLVFSCSINPGLEEVSKAPIADDARVKDLKIASNAFLLPSIVRLDKVELYLDKGAATTGKVRVEIRHSVTGVLAGSVTVAASTLAAGGSWKTFTFASPLALNRTEKYKLHIIRSGVHNYPAGNYIFWRTSSGGVDAYPNGINDVHPSWTLDYAFKTYTEGGLDQQQLLTTYGFAVGDTDSRWQEFVADYPKVTLKYMSLNLSTGSATSGNAIVQIRNADGSLVLAQNVVSASSLGTGTKWITFKISAILYRDQPYRIYLTRSDAHNYFANNYIFWQTSSGGVNAYPDGINDVYPSWNLDYAFRTYSAMTGLDQHQDLNNYGFFTSNNLYRWQEFVPRNQ
jgi:hypothetical protein